MGGEGPARYLEHRFAIAGDTAEEDVHSLKKKILPSQSGAPKNQSPQEALLASDRGISEAWGISEGCRLAWAHREFTYELFHRCRKYVGWPGTVSVDGGADRG